MRTKRTGGTPGRRALSVLLSLVLCLSLLPATAAAVETSIPSCDFTLTSDAALTAGSVAGEGDYYFEAGEDGGGTLYLHTNTPVTVSNTASAESAQNITVQAPSGDTESYTPKITLDEVRTTGTFTAAAGSDYDLALTVTGTNDLGQVLLWDYNTAGGDKATVTIDGAGTLNTSYLRAGPSVSSTTLTGITLNGGNINVDSDLKITGGTVKADSIYGGTVSISGGSVASTGTGGYGVYGAYGVTISGNAVVHATGGLVKTNSFTGSTSAQAGIGVGSGQTITIEGSARVTAKGSPAPPGSFTSGAPGIGTISNPNGTVASLTSNIVIQGNASVTATGTKHAAGIGAGLWNTANITIEDSPTITARGGENGAGIGLGTNYDDAARATIQISGTPKIDAQAGPDGRSGIGLGDGLANVNVTITGGSFAQGDISAQTVGGQTVAGGHYVDSGADSGFPYEVKKVPDGTVLVLPQTVELQMGRTQQFTLVGADSSAKVTWSVTGNKDEETKISDIGLLTLGMDETAGSTLTVKATVDGGSSYTAKVTVLEPEYTVTFAPGEGGSGTADPAKVSRNSENTFPYTLPNVGTGDGQINFTAPEGMHFAGWRVSGSATAESGSVDGHVLAAGTDITLSGDVTLTANWVVKPVVLLYGVELTDGGEGEGYSYSYNEATGVSTLTLNGYRGSGTATGEEVNSDGYYSALDCNHNLVLVLQGENSLTLTGTGQEEISGCGIRVEGDLIIRDGDENGTGSLLINVENFDSCFGILYTGGLTVEGAAVTVRRNQVSNDSTTYVLRGDGDEDVACPKVTGGSLTLIDASLEVTQVSNNSLSDDFRGKITVAHGPDDAGAYETDYNTVWASGMPAFPYVRVEAKAGYAPPTTYYPVWVAGKQVTAANADDVLRNDTVSYNPGSDTLTLNNAQITAPGGEGIRVEIDGAALYAAQGLTLSVTGDNTLTGTAVQVRGGTKSYGIYVELYDLTVTGSGTLTATGTAAENSYGMDTNSLTIDGVAVTARGGDATSSKGTTYGVSASQINCRNDGVLTGVAGAGPEGASIAGIYASPTGESSVLVSSDRSGTDLRPLTGGDSLFNFPYGVVYDPAATEVVICRDDAVVTADSLQVPTEDSLTVTYTATILDQLGQKMTDQSVTWSTVGTVPKGVNVSSGDVTVEVGAADGRFTLTAECDNGTTSSVEITVSNKADARVTISDAPTTITYGDSVFTLSATAQDPGTNGSWTWTSSDKDVLQVTQSTDGSATVAVTGAGSAAITANYISDTTMGSATVELTVAPKAVTITGLTAADKVYNGNANATASGNATLTGVEGDDEVTISNGSASFDDKRVGTGKKVTFTGYGLTGADEGNYTLSAQPASVTADITAKPIDVTGLAATDRVYDGTTRVKLTGGTLVDMISGDNVALNLDNACGDIADANVGNDKPVVVRGLALSGEDAGNYTLGQVAEVTVNITKANAPSLTGVTVQQRYSETSGQASVASVGMPSGAGTLAYAKEKESTTGTVTVSEWNVDESGKVTYTLSDGAVGATVTLPVVISSVNYQDATVNVEITLTEKNNQAALTLSNAEMTYGGNLTLSAAGGSGTGKVTYAIMSGGDLATLNGSVLTATGVGTVTVWATKAGDSNYNEATATATITIKKALPAMTLSASPSSLTGGGTVTLTLTGAPGSVTVTCTSDSGITVTEVDDQTWTVTLPSGAKSYTFSAAYAGDDNHESAAATCTVIVRSSGGGSSGGGSSSTTYVPSVDAGRNGDVTVSPSRPSSGQTVTITVDPDAGYALDDLTVTDARGNVVKVTDNGDGTYSFTQPSSKVTIEATFRETGAAADCPRDDTCPLAKFTDLDRNAWYHDGIHYCVENGLMAGTNATTFAPDVTTSRAMIAVILWRQAGSPAAEEYTDFSDVADGAWHTEGIRWASNAGVVMGYPDGIFRPSDPITREQLAAMLYRYAVYQGMESVTLEENLAGFTDADKISGYAIQAMNWAVGQGIMGGYGDNTLRPQGNATRAQAAAMLQRFCEKFGE